MADFNYTRLSKDGRFRISYVKENGLTVTPVNVDGGERESFYNSLSVRELKTILAFSVRRERYEAAARIRDLLLVRGIKF